MLDPRVKVFICGFWLGQAFYMIFGTEMFMHSMVRQGTDFEFAGALVDFVRGPMFIVCLLATIGLAAIGGALGYALFKKHFSKLAGGIGVLWRPCLLNL